MVYHEKTFNESVSGFQLSNFLTVLTESAILILSKRPRKICALYSARSLIISQSWDFRILS